MPEPSSWKSCESEPIPTGRLLLVWIADSDMPAIVRRGVNGGLNASGGFRIAVSKASFWKDIDPPEGKAMGRSGGFRVNILNGHAATTTREAQDNGKAF